MTPCRLFVDPPGEGAWNMAVDDVLLEDAADDGLASLRFYRWCEPTLSLGFFQRYAKRDEHAASRDAAVVRRVSGGGALLHDRELTYALALPGGHLLARRSEALYAVVHGALIDVLAERGVSASLQQDRPAAAPATRGDEPFLCFARRTAADVVVPAPAARGDAKIVGSAQRRRRGAVLQHGAVLLDASACAPELPGLAQLAGVSLAPLDLVNPWSARLAAWLNLQLDPVRSLEASSCQRCNDRATKFASSSWTRRR